MIYRVAIKDFAIIKDVEIDFEPGLNIMTGETGSGKSIIIEALSLALGARADSNYIRTGATKATVELFCEDLSGNEYVITREITSSGKNLCKLNGHMVALSEIASIRPQICDIHGQYDSNILLNSDSHLSLLDNYAYRPISKLKSKYKEAYGEYKEAEKNLSSLLEKIKDRTSHSEFYKYAIDEIERISPSENEDDELNERLKLLKNSEKIFSHVESALKYLDDEGGAVSSLGNASASLEYVSEYSSKIKKSIECINDSLFALQDILPTLYSMVENTEFDDTEIDSVISRINSLELLKKKYGPELKDVINTRNRMLSDLKSMENFDEEKARLENILHEASSDLAKASDGLSVERKKQAKILGDKIAMELDSLNFKNSSFLIELTELENYTESGKDDCRFLFSANQGESLKPLSSTASGGEISRIMLAIKNITGATDKIPTLIFDEIDSGISGKTASVVGKKLKNISNNHQIICITHLPQIAAFSDHSYKIYKNSDSESTYTHVSQLSDSEKVEELARLLAGENITESAVKNAKDLIAFSK